MANQLKDAEIQAAALADEHRRAMEELANARPTTQKKPDDKEAAKLKVEIAAMTKRAERYRAERDAHKANLDAMEVRADR